MATIGTFKKSSDGFTGTINSLTLNAKAKFVAVSAGDNEKAPAFRILAGTVEFGAAWKKISQTNNREYLSCKIDDPSLAAPIYASLVEIENEPGAYALLWSRRQSE